VAAFFSAEVCAVPALTFWLTYFISWTKTKYVRVFSCS